MDNFASAKFLPQQILPLLVVLAGVAGFEPTNDGIKIRCLTAWRHPYEYFVFSGAGDGNRTHDLKDHNLAL